MRDLLMVLAFVFCMVMFAASISACMKYRRENNLWASIGSALYMVVCLLALWGILK